MESMDFLNVSFCYDSQGNWLLRDFTAQFAAGWTGIVGANGAGKSTLLRLAAGELAPLSGVIQRPEPCIYCQQRTDEPPAMLDQLLAGSQAEACRIRGQLGLEADWLARWDSLSHGERKRAQIAAALWRRPAMLALDEPSNHIDAQARDLLMEALRGYRGIGLLVSHDRQLLDELCSHCLFMEHGQAQMRRGGYTAGRQQGQAAAQEIRRRHAQAKAQLRRIEQEMTRRRQYAAGEAQMRSKRKLAKGDSDGRARIDLARVTDSKSGASLRQLEGRLGQAEQAVSDIRVVKQDAMGIWVPQARSRRDRLFRIAPGRIALGPGRVLEFPELVMPNDGRVALCGPNGAGKSTLLRHIVAGMSLPADKVLYMPQEISAGQSRLILEQVRAMDHDRLGRILNIVSHLGSQIEPVLQTSQPSPGETRKIMLAMGIMDACHLILLDEPTNHLDLPSIECLEKALADCPCGLLLVSHDQVLMGRLTRTAWRIDRADESVARLAVVES